MSNTVVVRPRVNRVIVRAPGPQGPPGDVGDVSVTSVAGRTGDVTLTKGDVGLGSVDNTADASKPVSTLQAAADTAVANAAAAALASGLAGKAETSHTHTLSNLTQSGATNGQVVQWNGAAWVPATAGSSVMTPRGNVSSTSGSTTAAMPFDNTVPQITEGGEIITLADVTPSSSSSKILVQFSTFCVASTSNAMSFALFDGSTNAVAASVSTVSGPCTMVTVAFLVSSWTGGKTLSVRAGTPAGTLYWLRSAAEEKYSTSRQSIITATEIPAS